MSCIESEWPLRLACHSCWHFTLSRGGFYCVCMNLHAGRSVMSLVHHPRVVPTLDPTTSSPRPMARSFQHQTQSLQTFKIFTRPSLSTLAESEFISCGCIIMTWAMWMLSLIFKSVTSIHTVRDFCFRVLLLLRLWVYSYLSWPIVSYSPRWAIFETRCSRAASRPRVALLFWTLASSLAWILPG